MTAKLNPKLIRKMRQDGRNALAPLGFPAVGTALMSKVFCQQNLTGSRKCLQNKDNITSSFLMGKFGRLAGVLATSATLAGGVEAQEAPAPAEDVSRNATISLVGGTTEKVTDCVAFVKEQRDLQKEIGVAMSRKDQKLLLLDCRTGVIEDRIAQQQEVLAALDAQIHQIGLQVDEQARIIDEQGRELARIVAINNRLVIQRVEVQDEIDASRTRQEEMLKEAERILQGLIG